MIFYLAAIAERRLTKDNLLDVFRYHPTYNLCREFDCSVTYFYRDGENVTLTLFQIHSEEKALGEIGANMIVVFLFNENKPGCMYVNGKNAGTQEAFQHLAYLTRLVGQVRKPRMLMMTSGFRIAILGICDQEKVADKMKVMVRGPI